MLRKLSKEAIQWGFVRHKIVQRRAENRLQGYEFALACAALDRMAARYRDIMDKILDQAQAGGWKP